MSTKLGEVQNGGYINVYSEPGKGTTFTIYLPRYSGGAVAPSDAIAGVNISQDGNEVILLVEDEPSIMNMTTKMLNSMGYTVLKAATPDEAVRLADTHSCEISLLITDVVMPGMNGRELGDKLLAMCPNMKCLFMSGYTADVIASKGVLGNGINFIQKPFSKVELGEKVREILAKRQSA